MLKTWNFLSLFTIIGIFFFIGTLYLTIFASQSTVWADACQIGPGNNYNLWCASNSQAIACRGAPSCGTNPTREQSLSMCLNCCNSTGQFSGYNLCASAPPPPPPSCSGVCQYYISGCGPGGFASGSCGSSSLICCRPTNACEGAGGTCVGASSQGVAPCPAGKNYNTSLSCNNANQVCCAPTGGGPGGGGPGGGGGPPPPPPPPPTYSISGTVYQDLNNNGAKNTGEPGYNNATLQLFVRSSGSLKETQHSNSSGNFAFLGYLAGSYQIRITVPGGYASTTPTAIDVTVGPNRTGVNFGIVKLSSITGSIFNDINKNNHKDSGETKDWPNNIAISLSGGTGSISVNSTTGAYSITNLLPGTYTVTHSSPIPATYFAQYPKNGPPQSLRVTVGNSCSVTNSNGSGATCTAGNIINLNFAISNSRPWTQTYGGDVRDDQGYSNYIPANPTYQPYASVLDTLTGN